VSKPLPGSHAVPSPRPDPKLLSSIALALKENVDLLTGQRVGQTGNQGRAVSIAELVTLGVITQAQADSL
jgi:hypothetical protein